MRKHLLACLLKAKKCFDRGLKTAFFLDKDAMYHYSITKMLTSMQTCVPESLSLSLSSNIKLIGLTTDALFTFVFMNQT